MAVILGFNWRADSSGLPFKPPRATYIARATTFIDVDGLTSRLKQTRACPLTRYVRLTSKKVSGVRQGRLQLRHQNTLRPFFPPSSRRGKAARMQLA